MSHSAYIIMGLRLLVYIFLNKLPHNLSLSSFVSERNVVKESPHLTAIVKCSLVFLVIGKNRRCHFYGMLFILYHFLKSILIFKYMFQRWREVKLIPVKWLPLFLQKRGKKPLKWQNLNNPFHSSKPLLTIWADYILNFENFSFCQ